MRGETQTIGRTLVPVCRSKTATLCISPHCTLWLAYAFRIWILVEGFLQPESSPALDSRRGISSSPRCTNPANSQETHLQTKVLKHHFYELTFSEKFQLFFSMSEKLISILIKVFQDQNRRISKFSFRFSPLI